MKLGCFDTVCHRRNICYHDYVIKWEHFPCYRPFLRGIHRSLVTSLHKGQWRAALMFSLICAWINGWINNGEAGDLRRHGAHYDVIVMYRTHWWHMFMDCYNFCYRWVHLQRLKYLRSSSLLVAEKKVWWGTNCLSFHIPTLTWMVISMQCRRLETTNSSPMESQSTPTARVAGRGIGYLVELTRLPPVPHICVGKLGRHWFR